MWDETKQAVKVGVDQAAIYRVIEPVSHDTTSNMHDMSCLQKPFVKVKNLAPIGHSAPTKDEVYWGVS